MVGKENAATLAFYRSLSDQWLMLLRDAFEADLRSGNRRDVEFCKRRLAIIQVVMEERMREAFD